MLSKNSEMLRLQILLIVVVLFLADAASAQLAVRPEDPTGLSIREPRIRVMHAKTPDVPGTSLHLIQTDPWHAYRRGRSYFFREWGSIDRVFTSLPNRPEAAAGNSCGVCHNLPFPSLGTGGNVALKVGVGRTAPHFFGGGLLETIGLQIRAQILNEFDKNGNGYIDFPTEAKGNRAVIQANDGVELDFGSLDDEDGDGRPDLNPALMVRMVDKQGRRYLVNSEGKRGRLTDQEAVGFDLATGVFATTAGDHQFPSLRNFASGVFNTIMGILIEDTETEPIPLIPLGRSGYLRASWGHRTLNGAFESELFLTGDPMEVEKPEDRATITTGELDLLEWFLMNHPEPGLGPQNEKTLRGQQMLADFGCTSCHLPDWEILPEDKEKGFPGDRRAFHLEVAHNPRTDRLEGKLHKLLKEAPGSTKDSILVARKEGFKVKNVYSDLRHHDLGPRFWEYSYNKGKIQAVKLFRTSPLWGVGSTAPYGHDGRSATLDDVIRRHGGDAEDSILAYIEAPAEEREALIAFLRSLTLYRPETLPTDMDGDGIISENFKIGEHSMGPEVFRPEFFLANTPHYKGWTVGPDGSKYFSYALLNVEDAYGLNLDALVDRNQNLVPDLVEKSDESTDEIKAAGPLTLDQDKRVGVIAEKSATKDSN